MNKEKKNYEISPSDPNLRLYGPGQIVIKQGELYDGNLFILNSGRVAIIVDDRKITEINGSGEFVGEMSCILRCPRTATVKTIEESQISVYPRGFDRLIKTLPKVAIKIILQLAERLKNTTADQAYTTARANNLGEINDRLRTQYTNAKKLSDDLRKKLEMDN